jgi:two-component system, NtrC family, sensor histidine kinase HydH
MRIDRRTHWALLVAVLVALLGLVMLYRDYESEVANRRLVLLARGQTVLDALSAGIRAQGRMGRYRPERLSAIFDELAATPDIVGLELRTQGGTIISFGGDLQDFPSVYSSEPVWQENLLVLSSEPLLLGHGPGAGLGPGDGVGRGQGRRRQMGGFAEGEGWEPFPEGPYWLTALLDTTTLRAEIREDGVRFLTAGAVLLVAVSLGSWVMLARARQRKLRAALMVSQERVAQQQHLTKLGAGLAHETKNPLGIVRGLAQMIAESSESQEACLENRRHAVSIVDEIDRTVGQINSFLVLARPKEVTLSSVHLDQFFEEFVPLVEAEAQKRSIRLTYEDNDLRIRADAELLRRAMLNLLINAFRACKVGDEVRIMAEPVGESVSLTVSDTGCGIAPEDLGQVTEPYFSRFEDGSGLGLAIVKQIAQAHDWELLVESDPGRGARVILAGIERAESSGT